ncbi:MAG: hypothetical protein JSU68_07590 [Phycisphaerales bacterium]|nr:MAG: hypothetical protein JSU68_07590 [Phycisphaerales bacterium]
MPVAEIVPMSRPGLETFHQTSRKLDFIGPLESLLNEFRRGNIADRDRVQEESAIKSHLGEHREAWDLVFPTFPECPWKRRTMTWERHRGRRDVYLRNLVVTHVPQHETENRLIINPAAVEGRHARWLAHELPAYEVVGTDIDPRWNRLYRFVVFWKYHKQKNYRFVRESIFEPDLERHPAAVTFFGACGSVTDGCMDYAIAVNASFLICRSCCHDNIGGNTKIVRRPGRPINDFFAWKNYWYARIKKKRKGFYFADRYLKDAYPRSKAARRIMDSDTIIAVAQNAPESDICRSVIDLDRCLFLQENGYDVMYREELFFAHKRREATG